MGNKLSIATVRDDRGFLDTLKDDVREQVIIKNNRLKLGDIQSIPKENLTTIQTKLTRICNTSYTPDWKTIYDKCTICLEEYDGIKAIAIMSCNHHFHLGCLYDWLEKNPTCPVCRRVHIY